MCICLCIISVSVKGLKIVNIFFEKCETALLIQIGGHAITWNRAVANGPVGPAMAGPIIEPIILI